MAITLGLDAALLRRVATDADVVSNLAEASTKSGVMVGSFGKFFQVASAVKPFTTGEADASILRYFSAMEPSVLSKFLVFAGSYLAPFMKTVVSDHAKLKMMADASAMVNFESIIHLMSNTDPAFPAAKAQCRDKIAPRVEKIFTFPLHVLKRFLAVADPAVLKAYTPTAASVAKALCEGDFDSILSLMNKDKFRFDSPLDVAAEIAKDNAEKVVDVQNAKIAKMTASIEGNAHIVEDQAEKVRDLTAQAKQKGEEANDAIAQGNAAVTSANGNLKTAKMHERNALKAGKAALEASKQLATDMPKVQAAVKAVKGAGDTTQEQAAKAEESKEAPTPREQSLNGPIGGHGAALSAPVAAATGISASATGTSAGATGPGATGGATGATGAAQAATPAAKVSSAEVIEMKKEKTEAKKAQDIASAAKILAAKQNKAAHGQKQEYDARISRAESDLTKCGALLAQSQALSSSKVRLPSPVHVCVCCVDFAQT